MAIIDVTDLRIYKESLDALRYVYKLANLIPERHQRLRSQLIIAAESIPPLIAEGFAKRRSEKEFKRFLDMALGSSDEVVTHAREVAILTETYKRIPIELCNEIETKYKKISAGINKLRTVWVSFRR